MSETPKEKKRAAAKRLTDLLWPDGRQTQSAMLRDLANCDVRLVEYLTELADADGEQDGDVNTSHNYYEILGAVRFAANYLHYDFDARKVRQVIRLREGEWAKDCRGLWQHVRGGIRCPSNSGLSYYRWEPFQVFILASVFGFRCYVPTGYPEGSRDLAPTETIIDGDIYDYRRLCTDFTCYMPRKTDKTGLAAFIQVVFFLLEDHNAEIYCVANAAEQAKILYSRTIGMLRQLDTMGRLHITATGCDWKPTYHSVRSSLLKPLSAGGKTKDGLQAQLLCADEYGSAAWVKDHNDMKSLVDVVQSSMGPRREPLSFYTTTAGCNGEGPFQEKLDGLHRLLEMQNAEPTPAHAVLRTPTDRTMCYLLEPDAWERDEETLLTSHIVRHKVNPMLGKIVQQSFYDDGAARVRLDPTFLTEFVPKYMNVYRTDSVQEWISPEHVRQLTVGRRIDDCTDDEGWVAFAGMDFSLGDDLHALSFLAYNRQTGEFFADCDAWISEHSLQTAAMSDIYRQWIADGWMHVSPGETLAPELPVNRIASLFEDRGVSLLLFLYDPYKSRTPINALESYIYYAMGKRGRVVDPKQSVMPCRQNYATFNPLVMELDYMVKNDPPLIHFSASPLWAWEAGNMVLDTSTDGMENRKPRKRTATSKIDNWIALLMALRGYDIFSGRLNDAAQ